MAFSNFIPEVWSARLLEHLDKVHVYANLMNRDYEGEIRAFGDTVHINQVGAITISDYTGADLSTPEELDSTMQDLAIDKAKYFNFQIKDVDNAQSNPKLVDAAMQRASYGMNDVIDQYLASLLVSGVDAGNILADDSKAVTPTSATAYDYLVDLSVKLDEANVPMPGRWVVVPPWYHGLLLAAWWARPPVSKSTCPTTCPTPPVASTRCWQAPTLPAPLPSSWWSWRPIAWRRTSPTQLRASTSMAPRWSSPSRWLC